VRCERNECDVGVRSELCVLALDREAQRAFFIALYYRVSKFFRLYCGNGEGNERDEFAAGGADGEVECDSLGTR
jgi:hypothetical protein